MKHPFDHLVAKVNHYFINKETGLLNYVYKEICGTKVCSELVL